MIYVLARHIDDARSYAFQNGVERRSMVYVGQSWNLPRTLHETDRIVRTAHCEGHPAHAELERMLAHTVLTSGLTETRDGRLVRRQD